MNAQRAGENHSETEKNMPHQQVNIATDDGICPTDVYTPADSGAWPAVIFHMDGLGIRPTLNLMAQRLADAGYVVLLPDLYYRAGPYGPLDPQEIFASGDVLKAIGHLFSTTNPALVGKDSAFYLSYLDTRSDVAGKKIGTTGYCMGGAMSLATAASHPDRVAAAASFHGGGLATDASDSPHLLAPRIKARVYVAGADQDPFYPPEMAERLEKALSDAHVDHRCEIYEGALHGWTMADFPIYNQPAAERHWRELLGLFAATLR